VFCNNNLLSWVTDYLDDKKQKVVLDRFSSGWEGIDAGVPLFLIYIDDIVDDLDCNININLMSLPISRLLIIVL
jgi:hypothetical protein